MLKSPVVQNRNKNDVVKSEKEEKRKEGSDSTLVLFVTFLSK